MMYPHPPYMWADPCHHHMPPYHQPWPYPVPQQPHGCHTYYGSCPYTFHPHYPPPPPPLFYPQHYSVQRPWWYEYDKNNHHSCGCNLHQDDNRPKVTQPDNKPSDSMVPDYPIMCAYTESKANDNDKYSHDPVLVKRPEPPKQGENGEVDQDEQDKQFPFKIFWLPDKVGKDTKENNLDLVANNEGSSSVRTTKNNETSSSKHAVQKVIPVKQASTDEEKKSLKSSSDSVEKMDNGSRASPKASKLPPVCLRIDPLPKKKKSSPSPSPGEKGRSNESPVNSPKPSQHQVQVLKKQSEGNIKNIDHAEKVEQANLANNVEQAYLANHANKVEQANHGDMPKEKGDESLKEKKNMSEHDAALIIQSVYRGFEVRKSQPMKKLKQINEVRKQVSELRNRVQDLETSSSTTSFDVGETIMSLLLKLDTIQGLHPFVREIRKSVAKELVGLQEKLDSLVKSETQSEGTNYSHQQAEDDGKLDQAQAQTSLFENHERKDDAEACNTPNVEQQLEKNTEQDEFDQAKTESDTVICENHEAEAAVLQEASNTIGELQLESPEEMFQQAQTECDESLGLYGEESHEDYCNKVGESHKEKWDQAASECDDDMKVEDNAGEVNKKQPENAESMMQQADDKKNVVESGDVEMDMVFDKANEGDRRLMEENEKLRAAVEELMKAGTDQLGVIRELTGRVKDLEKKLSKKKKKKKVKVNKGRRVRDCDCDCVV